MPLLVAGDLTPPNVALLDAAREMGVQARLLPPETAARRARPDDVVLGRLDVLPTLDGVERGLESLAHLEASGVRVLNGVDALLAAHDKLETAKRLHEHGLPHPRTWHIPPGGDPATHDPYLPVVLKPRFGSWGADVMRCESHRELGRAFSKLSKRGWFQQHGVLVQELLPPPGADLRLVVACREVVGAIGRHAARGEWRTNVALGGTRRPANPPIEARRLAVEAAAAIGADLVGVDLLPTRSGYVVLELNGCVDFTGDYSLPGGDVFADAVERLLFPAVAELERLHSPGKTSVNIHTMMYTSTSVSGQIGSTPTGGGQR
jgi:[lysine-biosynthesis-protein LysW]--L-2-aminoadipate ligase